MKIIPIIITIGATITCAYALPNQNYLLIIWAAIAAIWCWIAYMESKVGEVYKEIGSRWRDQYYDCVSQNNDKERCDG